MEMLTLLTFLLVCLPLTNKVASQNVTGRCCEAMTKGSSGGDGCGAAVGQFHPPMNTEEEKDIFWKTQDLHCPSTHNTVYYDMKNGSKNILVLSQGKMTFQFAAHNFFKQQTSEYCVEAHDGGYRAAVCRPDPDKICDSAVCVPKCCSDGEVLQHNLACSKGTAENMSLQFYSIYGQLVSAPSGVEWVGDMMPDCSDSDEKLFNSISFDVSRQHLLLNGKLSECDIGMTYEWNHYCIEDMYKEGTHSRIFVTCKDDQKALNVKPYVLKVGYVVTIIFLIITTLFHVFIPSLQDTQSLCLISHMVSLGVNYIVLLYLSFDDYIMIPHGFCIFSGFLFHYSYLATFFWLNIMCFDIWGFIRETTKGIPLIGILSNNDKKFRLFSVYGWGCPLVLTVVAAIMHSLPKEYTKNIIAPEFGRDTCWLLDDMERLVYCYAYVVALFILDLILCGHTIFMLFRAGSSFACFSREVSVTAFNRKHLDAFWHRFSLFMLVVLCWTANILSWKIPPQDIWIVTDFINSAQGFLMFVIFLSNKKKRDLVKGLLKKVSLRCFKPRETISLTNGGVKMSSLHSPCPSHSSSSSSDIEILHVQQLNGKASNCDDQ